MKYYILIFLLATGLAVNAQTTWTLDKAHSNIRFTATHMLITDVDGEFADFDATMVSQSDDFDGAQVEFSARIASINTGNDKRDGHLQADDFFNAAAFPELTFKGTLEKEGSAYYLVGDFTIRDISRKVRFDVQYNGTVDMGETKKAGFKVTGTIDRFEYGLKWDRAIETGGLVVAKEIDITCNVQMNGQ